LSTGDGESPRSLKIPAFTIAGAAAASFTSFSNRLLKKSVLYTLSQASNACFRVQLGSNRISSQEMASDSL